VNKSTISRAHEKCSWSIDPVNQKGLGVPWRYWRFAFAWVIRSFEHWLLIRHSAFEFRHFMMRPFDAVLPLQFQAGRL
jgi:hypothetical protein